MVETDPLGHSVVTTYNSAVLVASITDRLGRSQNFSYDADNRVVSNVWKNASNQVVDTLSYGYDTTGNLTSASNNNGGYTRVYDVLGQVSSQTDPFGVTLTISHDAAGYRTSVADSQGGTIGSVYDAGGRLTRRTFSGGSLPTMRIDLGYNNRDQLTSLNRYADLAGTQLVGTSALAYDNAGNLTNLQHKDGSGANLANYVNVFDANNRITSETRNGGPATNYSYDATSQLTTAGTTNFSYDANGNRTMPGYVVGADNRLASDGTWNYTYDNAGNLAKKVNIASGLTWTYSYDNLNRLLSAEQYQTDGGTLLLTLSYKYDVFGNLIEEDRTPAGQGTTVVRHAYDDQGMLWADLNSANAIQTRYIRGDEGSQIFARVTSATVNWLLQDRLGSIRDVTNAAGSVIDTNTFSSFGAITSQTNSTFTGEFGYTGQLFSIDTGLNFMRARVYDPITGTWLEEDPIGMRAGSANFRRYVGNDSTNEMDPSGMAAAIVGQMNNKHTGIEVDVYAPFEKENVIHSGLYTYRTKVVAYRRIGVLTADFGAAGYLGTEKDREASSLDNEVTGMAGNIVLGFKRGHQLTSSRRVEGGIEESRRLVRWIAGQVGKDEKWIIAQFKPINLDENRQGMSTKRLRRVGPDRTYKALTNSCNHFTAEAMDVYLGYKWKRTCWPKNGWDLLDEWDRAVEIGKGYKYKGGRPSENTPSPEDWDAILRSIP